jgi:hypothetical protein
MLLLRTLDRVADSYIESDPEFSSKEVRRECYEALTMGM